MSVGCFLMSEMSDSLDFLPPDPEAHEALPTDYYFSRNKNVAMMYKKTKKMNTDVHCTIRLNMWLHFADPRKSIFSGSGRNSGSGNILIVCWRGTHLWEGGGGEGQLGLVHLGVQVLQYQRLWRNTSLIVNFPMGTPWLGKIRLDSADRLRLCCRLI